MSTQAESVTGGSIGGGIELAIGGMTCASCANRIERKLNKLDGVSATVNYATEKARVTVPDDFDPALLIEEVEKTGYTATLPAPRTTSQPPTTGGTSAGAAAASASDPAAADAAPGTQDADADDPELTALRHRLIGSIVLSVPVIAMAMIPALSSRTGSGRRSRSPPPSSCGAPGRSTAPRG